MIKFLIVLSLVLTPFYSNGGAKELQLSNDCIELMKERDKEFEEKVFTDVLSSYEYLHKDDSLLYFTDEDLDMMLALLGREDKRVESLRQFFEGGSTGERRLYLFGGYPDRAFMLYKSFSNDNVMIELKRGEQAWEKVDTTVRNGEGIEVERLECEEKYYLDNS